MPPSAVPPGPAASGARWRCCSCSGPSAAACICWRRRGPGAGRSDWCWPTRAARWYSCALCCSLGKASSGASPGHGSASRRWWPTCRPSAPTPSSPPKPAGNCSSGSACAWRRWRGASAGAAAASAGSSSPSCGCWPCRWSVFTRFPNTSTTPERSCGCSAPTCTACARAAPTFAPTTSPTPWQWASRWPSCCCSRPRPAPPCA